MLVVLLIVVLIALAYGQNGLNCVGAVVRLGFALLLLIVAGALV